VADFNRTILVSGVVLDGSGPSVEIDFSMIGGVTLCVAVVALVGVLMYCYGLSCKSYAKEIQTVCVRGIKQQEAYRDNPEVLLTPLVNAGSASISSTRINSIVSFVHLVESEEGCELDTFVIEKLKTSICDEQLNPRETAGYRTQNPLQEAVMKPTASCPRTPRSL